MQLTVTTLSPLMWKQVSHLYSTRHFALAYQIQQSSICGSICDPLVVSYSRKHSSIVWKSLSSSTCLSWSLTNFVSFGKPSNFPTDSFFFLKLTLGPKFFFLRPLCDASHPNVSSTPSTSRLHSSGVKKSSNKKTPGNSWPFKASWSLQLLKTVQPW